MRHFLFIRHFCFLVIFILINPITGFGQSQKKMIWKAGIASINITPTQSMWMAGYASRNHPSEGVRQDVWIKALALEDQNGQRGVMVSMDLCLLPKDLSDRVRDIIKKKYGLDKKQLILNVSHTHSGPSINPDDYVMTDEERLKVKGFAQDLEIKIVKLVGMALEDMKPSRLYSGNGLTRFQVNRRNNKEHNLKSFTELNGPNDYAVPVIKIVDNNNQIKAILFGYACHATVLSDYLISGDYPGYAQATLEEMFPEAIALFFQGAGGDQNPLPRREPQLAEQYGRELAAAVVRILKTDMRELTAELFISYPEIRIGLDNPPGEEELESIIASDSDYPAYNKQRAKVLLEKMKRGIEIPPNYPYPVQVWRIGEQPVFALGGELLVGYAIELKRIFGDNIFVFGYCNDVMGYVPTVTVLREGGYEGNRAPYVKMFAWEANIEYLIIHETIHLANEAGIER